MSLFFKPTFILKLKFRNQCYMFCLYWPLLVINLQLCYSTSLIKITYKWLKTISCLVRLYCMFFIPATYPCFIHTCTCCKMSQSLIQHWALRFNVTVLPFILLIFIVLTHHFASVMLIIIYILLYNILIDVLLYFGIHDTFLQLMCYILTVGVLCLLVTIMQNCMYQRMLSSL
jgi:hypothetical protein